MKEERYNVLDNLSLDDQRKCRFLFSNLILGTDEDQARENLEHVIRMQKEERANPEKRDRVKLLSCVFNLACNSTSMRNYECFEKWTALQFKELFRMGEREKKKSLEASPLADKRKVNVVLEQGNMLKRNSDPLFDLLSQKTLFPALASIWKRSQANKDTLQQKADMSSLFE